MIKMLTFVSCFDGTHTHPAGLCTLPPDMAKRMLLRGQGVLVDKDDAPMKPAATVKALRLTGDDLSAAPDPIRKIYAADVAAVRVAAASKPAKGADEPTGDM
jgi:hypothetical protein